MELVIPSGFFPWHQYTCSSVHIRNDLLYHENGSSLPKFGQYLAFGVLLLFKNFNGNFTYNKPKLIHHQRTFMLSGEVWKPIGLSSF
jgi:hypothetical protein